MRTDGFYYDGLSSHRVQVEVYLVSGGVMIHGPGVDIKAPLASVTLEEAVGGGRSVLRFADGGMCAFDDAPFADQVSVAQGKRVGLSRISRWERSLFLSIVALLIVAAVVAVAVRYGVPALSRRVAFIIPLDVEKRLGEEVLAALDKVVFKPSGLPEESIERLSVAFHDVAQGTSIGDNARILFRKGGRLGANAVAIPSGIVVMTDELVLLAQDDWEIAAVMAHEAGHIRGRHSMRHLLQNSMTALIVSAAIGDFTSVSSMAAAAPTLLINAKYSRDFEREADAESARYLLSRGVSWRKFADMLERLEADHERKIKEKSSQAELKRILESLDELERKKERASRSLNELESEKDRISKSLDELESEKDRISRSLDEMESEKDRISRSLYELKSKKEMILGSLDELESKKEMILRSLGELESKEKSSRAEQKSEKKSSLAEDYLSSHPPVQERIRELESIFRQDGS